MAFDDERVSLGFLQATGDLGGSTSIIAPSPAMSAQDRTQPTLSGSPKGDTDRQKDVPKRSGPLNLLDLPEDILRLVIKEMARTNDLTSLALTNSTLHGLAVPHIYSRFDIVWPDSLAATSESKSVDALTYGLSTLCLGSSFEKTLRNAAHPMIPAPPPVAETNDHAKYTRNFSLGNGPEGLVSEYVITKESGKMLGTLVAMAVGKMVNLESFVWDMPTGVLSDVFMSLASLSGHHENNACKLSRVWIRWHDSTESPESSSLANGALGPQAAIVPIGSTLTPVGILLPSHASHPPAKGPVSYADHHAEYPTFSVLPPVTSLTVLEVDELAYLDEMADLIGRSVHRLRELRVGIAARAAHKDFVQTWDGPTLHQVDHDARWPGQSTIGERRLGGVLGVLVGKTYDIRRKVAGKCRGGSQGIAQPGAPATASTVTQTSGATLGEDGGSMSTAASAHAASTHGVGPGSPSPAHPSTLPPRNPNDPDSTEGRSLPAGGLPARSSSRGRKRLDGKLRLQTLELERIPLSMQVCRHAVDWSVLSNLTILECAQHENLWKVLGKQFQPSGTGTSSGASGNKTGRHTTAQYHLSLKRIHTDMASLALVRFIKETLAPNTLEVLFLQDRRKGFGPPPVSIEQVFRGAVKPHRSSLRKLLLDSATKGAAPATETAESNSTRWENWVLTSEILAYVMSGRMSSLRELAVSLSYRDWHTFLQRLPDMSQLRSLNIPFVAEYTTRLKPEEFAMQILSTITLRPEIQLRYVGISTNCFEILESRPTDRGGDRGVSGGGGGDGGGNGDGDGDGAESEHVVDPATSVDDGDGENDDDVHGDDEETSEEDDGQSAEGDGEDEDGTPLSPVGLDETQSDIFGAEDSDDDSFIELDSLTKTEFRLRDILFYDDKVDIFKARHGRL